MRKEVLVIYNPKSGKNGANAMLPKVVNGLCARDCRVTVYPILSNFGAEEILAAEDGKCEHVVCCGGDGSLNHTINGLMRMENRPLLTYIPSGSTNDFAASMGISSDIVKSCQALVHGTPFYYDIGKFNDKYFNYIAAFGAFTQVSYSTPQNSKNYLGHAAYIIEGLRHLPSGQFYNVTVTSEEKIYKGDYVYGSVSNSTSIGGVNLGNSRDISMNDGLFEVLLIKAPKNVLEVQNIIASILMQNFDSPYIDYFKSRSVKMEFASPTSWTLDGEFGGNVSCAQISVINQAIGLMK